MSHSMSLLPSVGLLLGRLSFGALFAMAGWMKVFTMGVGNFYTNAFKPMSPFPQSFDLLLKPYGYALPWLELILGVMLVIGLFGRTTAWLISAILASIIIAQTFSAPTLLEGLRAGGQSPFNLNFIFLSLTILLATMGPGAISIDALICRKCKTA